MAYYLVSRMPPGETKLIQAPSALEAARGITNVGYHEP
jgi:hypothetical protein